MSCRVLCTGDIHIGRRASKVSGTYRTADAWKSVVDTAIEEQVDVVVLSGDVIDQSNATYEALGPFQDGLRRLGEAGTQTVAVAGNHDFDALPRLARLAGAEHFHLLGKGETWETLVIEREGHPILAVVGWSFARQHVATNPMSTFTPVDANGLPVLGVLHAELDARRGNYAPVPRDDLFNQNVDLWLLGHIHVPSVTRSPAGRIACYPGSPLPMDPGEPGVHGVWIVDFIPGQLPELKQLHSSPIRYVTKSIELSGVEQEEDFIEAVNSALFEIGQIEGECNNRSALREISCRLHIQGSSPAHREIPAWADRAREGLSATTRDSILVSIDTISVDVRPPINLQQLSSGSDPVAETARLLLALSEPDLSSQHGDLVQKTHRRLLQIHKHSGYATLLTADTETTTEEPSEQDARNLLSDQAWKLLAALVDQKART